MADAAPKTPKKKVSKPKKPANHPKYSEMIKAALGALKERGGSSRQALLKYILKNYNIGKEEKIANSHLKLALRAGVKNGTLKQAKGTGASGSFKLGEKPKAKKPAAKKPKAKKPAAKKPKAKKPAAKKAKSPKKVAKPKKAKTPKKAAKPKKAKTPKKPKAAKPKKAKSPAKKKAAKPKAKK